MAVRLGARPQRGIHRRKAHPMAEINVTPMVDVMLVLLVIFMITAPLLTVGVPVDLPKTKAEAMQDPDEPLVVSINKEGKIFLQEAELSAEQLGPRVAAISNNNPDVKIFIRGDQAVNYGEIAEVLGQLVSAGFRHLALISDSAAPAPADGALQGGSVPERSWRSRTRDDDARAVKRDSLFATYRLEAERATVPEQRQQRLAWRGRPAERRSARGPDRLHHLRPADLLAAGAVAGRHRHRVGACSPTSPPRPGPAGPGQAERAAEAGAAKAGADEGEAQEGNAAAAAGSAEARCAPPPPAPEEEVAEAIPDPQAEKLAEEKKKKEEEKKKKEEEKKKKEEEKKKKAKEKRSSRRRTMRRSNAVLNNVLDRSRRPSPRKSRRRKSPKPSRRSRSPATRPRTCPGAPDRSRRRTAYRGS